jgi:hypothetical protein
MVDWLVKPEHQFQGDESPIHPLRMSWPFKTDEEREVVSKWNKKQSRKSKLLVVEEAPF